MKTLIITIALAAACLTSHGQGWVLFQNASNTRISTNSVVGGPATGDVAANDGTAATAYSYALFSSTTDSSVDGSTAPIIGVAGTEYAFQSPDWYWNNPTNFVGYIGGDIATNNNLAGHFNSAVPDPNESGGTMVDSGNPQYFTIIGWNVPGVTSVAQLIDWYNNGDPLSAGFIGESAVSGLITPSTVQLQVPSPIMGTVSPDIPGFVLGLAVPEPGTLALAAIGGASLLLFRRRK